MQAKKPFCVLLEQVGVSSDNRCLPPIMPKCEKQPWLFAPVSGSSHVISMKFVLDRMTEFLEITVYLRDYEFGTHATGFNTEFYHFAFSVYFLYTACLFWQVFWHLVCDINNRKINYVPLFWRKYLKIVVKKQAWGLYIKSCRLFNF